jgi:exopolysaccharide biosynthesis protein
LDAFVIPKAIQSVESGSNGSIDSSISTNEESSSNLTSENTSLDLDQTLEAPITDPTSDSAEQTSDLTEQTLNSTDQALEPIITDDSYEDENMKIDITTLRQYDSTLYIADIIISDPSLLKTAFAKSSYGRNIKDVTSNIAEDNDAIFAINGDFYGFRDAGFVLRNGILYQSTPRDDSDAEALRIDMDGNFSILNEMDTDITSLSDDSWQIFTFGPSLIDEGVITVNSKSEVDTAKNSNPRTAIGQISELHYVILVADGRTDESDGLTLLELATTLEELGCETAYNLDGGGSSTMYFNGEIVNVPTSGKSISERSVSDIVYFGY